MWTSASGAAPGAWTALPRSGARVDIVLDEADSPGTHAGERPGRSCVQPEPGAAFLTKPAPITNCPGGDGISKRGRLRSYPGRAMVAPGTAKAERGGQPAGRLHRDQWKGRTALVLGEGHAVVHVVVPVMSSDGHGVRSPSRGAALPFCEKPRRGLAVRLIVQFGAVGGSSTTVPFELLLPPVREMAARIH